MQRETLLVLTVTNPQAACLGSNVAHVHWQRQPCGPAFSEIKSQVVKLLQSCLFKMWKIILKNALFFFFFFEGRRSACVINYDSLCCGFKTQQLGRLSVESISSRGSKWRGGGAATRTDSRPGIKKKIMSQFPPEMLSEKQCFIYTSVSAWQQQSHIINVQPQSGCGGGGDVRTTVKWSIWARKPHGGGDADERACAGLRNPPTGNSWLGNVGNSVFCTCCCGRTPPLYDIKGWAQSLTAFVKWNNIFKTIFKEDFSKQELSVKSCTEQIKRSVNYKSATWNKYCHYATIQNDAGKEKKNTWISLGGPHLVICKLFWHCLHD